MDDVDADETPSAASGDDGIVDEEPNEVQLKQQPIAVQTTSFTPTANRWSDLIDDSRNIAEDDVEKKLPQGEKIPEAGGAAYHDDHDHDDGDGVSDADHGDLDDNDGDVDDGANSDGSSALRELEARCAILQQNRIAGTQQDNQLHSLRLEIVELSATHPLHYTACAAMIVALRSTEPNGC